MSISLRPSIFFALVVTLCLLPLAANGQTATDDHAAASAFVLEPVVPGPTEAYPFNTPDPEADAKKAKELFRGRANIQYDARPESKTRGYLIVRGTVDAREAVRNMVAEFTGQTLDYVNANTIVIAPMATQDPTSTNRDNADAAHHRQALAELSRIAKARFSEAKTDEEKIAIRTELKQRLAEAFAFDMREREKRAAEIEARLTKLREQYQAREKKKEEIIELQAKAIELDADDFEIAAEPPQENQSAAPVGPNQYAIDRQGSKGASDRPLEQLKKEQPQLVAELAKFGHFVESPDGKWHVLVSANHPSGPSLIDVIDSQSGRLMLTASVATLVGPLQFTEEGIASRESDGSLQLRIPMPRLIEGAGIIADAGDREKKYQAAADAQTRIGAAGIEEQFVSEYSTLEERFRKVRAMKAEFEQRIKFAGDRGVLTQEQVEQQKRIYSQFAEKHEKEMNDAKKILNAKIRFLNLDLKSAKSSLDAEKATLELFQKPNYADSITSSELAKQKAAVEAAEINVEKAATLLELFSSIENESD